MLRRICTTELTGLGALVGEILYQLADSPYIDKRIVQWDRGKPDDVWLPPIGNGPIVCKILKKFATAVIGQQGELATTGIWVTRGDELELWHCRIDFKQDKL